MGWRAMTVAARTGFLGLVTNVACTQAPEGALQIAENVVLRRAGCVEPRDGVILEDEDANPAVWGFSLDDDTDVVARWTGAAFTWEVLGGAALQYADPVSGTNVNPQPFRRDVLARARLRGRIYVPTDSGVFRVTAADFQAAGVPPYVFFNSLAVTALSAWLPDTESVAYRLVTKTKGSDGVIVSSLPTGALAVTNSAGAARGVIVNLLHGQQFDALFTSVEIYRTRNFAAGITVDDEMQLVGEVDASAFTLVGSTYQATFLDETLPVARGKTLYTSPSRGGIVQQNERPPAAACAEAFKGHLFFGNVRGPERVEFSFRYGGTLTGTAGGIGVRTYNGDTTIGVNTITNLSSTVGIERGMIVTGDFPVNTYVTNIAGTTATTSANATATNVGTARVFSDAIKVNGLWLLASELQRLLSFYGTGAQYAYSITPPKGGYTTSLVVETISRIAGGSTVQATHGSEYDPPLPNYLGTPLEYDQDASPGAIMWSKLDEPEHVAPLSYRFVGDKAKAILGLVPTRDALFIVKEDGVFRLTGSGGNGVDPWRVDPYDPTTRCILPTSVKPLNGRAYFLSNKGVVAFGDAGAEPVSKAIHDLVRDLIDEVIENFQDTGFYEVNGVVGSTAAVFERENEYTLMRSSLDPMLVYNENTNAWTTWDYYRHVAESLALKGVFTLEREGRVAYAVSGLLHTTSLSTDAQLGTLTLPQHADGILTRTASGYASGVVTLTAATTVLLGDVIQDAAGKLWEVRENYITSTLIEVAGPATSFTTGTVYVYRALRCRVAPQTFYGDPAVAKDSSPLTATFSRFQGPVALDFEYSSQLTPRDDGDWDSAEVPLEQPLGYADLSRGASKFLDVPNDHRRAWLLDVAVAWTMSHGVVRLEGIYLESRLGKQRTRQHEEA